MKFGEDKPESAFEYEQPRQRQMQPPPHFQREYHPEFGGDPNVYYTRNGSMDPLNLLAELEREMFGQGQSNGGLPSGFGSTSVSGFGGPTSPFANDPFLQGGHLGSGPGPGMNA